MKIGVKDFRTLEIEEEHVVQSSQSIFGFEEYRKFILIDDSNTGDGICWLQSVKERQVCFTMLSPLEIKSDYTPVVNNEILDQLKTESKDELGCWMLLAVGKTFQQSTANLKNPIIVSRKTNLAVQVILGQDYAIRQLMFGEGKMGVC